MNVFYDLHIHSALSPCADDDMTPNNVVNMARLKGLDVITVCDHNCAANVPAFERAAMDAGIVLIPGIEITSAEEVHILAFFSCGEAAKDFGDWVYASLPNVENNESFFGHQYVMNEKDEIIEKREKLLLTSLPYDFEQCCSRITSSGGVPVPAHVNKESNSVLANLGFFPPAANFATIEVSAEHPQSAVPDAFRWLHSSDAHMLWQIAEPAHILQIEDLSVASLLRTISA